MNILKQFWGFFFAKPCHKEDLGYNCKHRIYNGMRECDGSKV